MELTFKFLYLFAVGLTAGATWVSTIQIQANANTVAIKDLQHVERENERKYIDVLGRIDERLKNIEKKN